MDEAVQSGTLQAAIDGRGIRDRVGAPALEDFGARELVGGAIEDGSQRLPVTGELLFVEAAEVRVVGAVGGQLDDSLAWSLGVGRECVQPATAVVVGRAGVAVHLNRDIDVVGEGTAATNGLGQRRIGFAPVMQRQDSEANGRESPERYENLEKRGGTVVSQALDEGGEGINDDEADIVRQAQPGNLVDQAEPFVRPRRTAKRLTEPGFGGRKSSRREPA